MPTPILIDTDPGIDDAVALALAAKLPELKVVAITTVHGNTDVDRATRNARLVAAIAGLDAPIVAGAAAPLVREPRPARETHGAEGLGHVIPAQAAEPEVDGAAEAIIAQVRGHHKLTLCCMGPLTNLATAIAFAPDIADALGPVFVMGGALGVPGTQTPAERVQLVVRSRSGGLRAARESRSSARAARCHAPHRGAGERDSRARGGGRSRTSRRASGPTRSASTATSIASTSTSMDASSTMRSRSCSLPIRRLATWEEMRLDVSLSDDDEARRRAALRQRRADERRDERARGGGARDRREARLRALAPGGLVDRAGPRMPIGGSRPPRRAARAE